MKRGTKEPVGSEDIPCLDRHCGITDRPPKGEPGYVPCWWSEKGTTDKEHRPTFGATKKYSDNYDKIRWDNE